jgi:hypothetical protein
MVTAAEEAPVALYVPRAGNICDEVSVSVVKLANLSGLLT